MENSPNIEFRGLDVIKRALFRKGYSRVAWGVFSAEDVGAPHVRKRFYVVAAKHGTRSDAIVRCVSKHLTKERNRNDDTFWKRNPEPARVVLEKKEDEEDDRRRDIKHRGFLLGNAIVPQCARHACEVLFTYVYEKSTVRRDATFFVKVEKQKQKRMDGKTTMMVRMRVPDRMILPPRGKKTYEKRLLATPLASRWNPTRIGGERASDILPNQIMYDVETQKYMMAHGKRDFTHWTVSPEFVEWMMGYPRGWTDIFE